MLANRTFSRLIKAATIAPLAALGIASISQAQTVSSTLDVPFSGTLSMTCATQTVTNGVLGFNATSTEIGGGDGPTSSLGTKGTATLNCNTAADVTVTGVSNTTSGNPTNLTSYIAKVKDASNTYSYNGTGSGTAPSIAAGVAKTLDVTLQGLPSGASFKAGAYSYNVTLTITSK